MSGMNLRLGTGLHGRGSGSGAGAFTPLGLYAGSEGGGWYDFSDLSTLWQDTGGTVAVTADGQSVARVDDKSGNGNHVTQGTASKRPVYKTDGSLHWLLFDGVDDREELSAWASGDLVQPGTIAVGAETGDVTDARNIVDAASPTNSLRWTSYKNVDDMLIFAGSAVTYATDVLAANTSFVSLVEINGASSFGRFNGTQSGSLNAGSSVMRGIFIGDYANAGGEWSGKIFQVIVTDDQLTSQEISDTESFIADKSGVTL